MAYRNTDRSFGTLTRMFHWLTALLIVTAFPLGLMAQNAPYATAEEVAAKMQLFSLHKTLGVAVFFVALARILWALAERRPAPLHPERRAETFVASLVHWLLYLSLVAVPLSGWILHSATTGMAPIHWPFGQGLPFVPKSAGIAAAAGLAHYVFTKIMLVSVILHVAGALKHAVWDRDATLRRMLSGAAGGKPGRGHGLAAPVLALAVYAAGSAAALSLSRAAEDTPASTAIAAAPAAAGRWQVVEGTLAVALNQMGTSVSGGFSDWSAGITFEETASAGIHGQAEVTIQTGSFRLGTVSEQAKGKDFFDVSAFPTATFRADILPGDGMGRYVAKGSLTLKGQEVPVELPFSLTADGDLMRMRGTLTLDRRDFGIGDGYKDEKTLGFAVVVTVDLAARRQ